MRHMVNPVWAASREAEIRNFQTNPGGAAHIDVTTEFRPAAQWLVMKLAQAGIGYRVIPMGAGVTRVTTDTKTCPKCHGTGRA